MKRLLAWPTALAVLSGAAAALALGALNQAAHPLGWPARLLWAAGGLLAAMAALLCADRAGGRPALEKEPGPRREGVSG